MPVCIAVAGALVAALATEGFSLVWSHSVEKTEWREEWRVEGSRLRLAEAAVRGSGAGMEPPTDAAFVDGRVALPAGRVAAARLGVGEFRVRRTVSTLLERQLPPASEPAATRGYRSCGTVPMSTRRVVLSTAAKVGRRQ